MTLQGIPTLVAAPALVTVVAAALVRADGTVCLQQRPLAKQHGGLWEFPGGKVEGGESPEAALVREIAEELGIALDSQALVPAAFACGGGIAILLYAARKWTGEVRCLEGEAIGWFEPARIAALAMPPLDYPLAERLRQLLLNGVI